MQLVLPDRAERTHAAAIWSAGLLLFLLSFGSSFDAVVPDIYVVLADSFAHGRLDVEPIHQGHDLAPFAGKHYAPQGPLPAVLLMPAALAFGPGFNVNFLQFPLHFLNLFLLRSIARRLGYSERAAAAFTFLFVFASPYFGVAKIASYTYVAHVVCVTLGLCAVWVFLSEGSWAWIGLAMAGAMATRATAGLGAGFFALVLLRRWRDGRADARRDLALLGAPVLAAGLLLASYNQLRFDRWWEGGYGLQQINVPRIQANRDHGVFSLQHVPGNLYALLLQSPDPVVGKDGSTVLRFPFVRPNIWGMGIVFVSPYLMYLLVGRARDRLVPLLWITIAGIAAPLLVYYGVGVKQYGYRYGLDFFPFLYWLFLIKVRDDVGPPLVRLGILAVAFNLYLGVFYR